MVLESENCCPELVPISHLSQINTKTTVKYNFRIFNIGNISSWIIKIIFCSVKGSIDGLHGGIGLFYSEASNSFLGCSSANVNYFEKRLLGGLQSGKQKQLINNTMPIYEGIVFLIACMIVVISPSLMLPLMTSAIMCILSMCTYLHISGYRQCTDSYTTYTAQSIRPSLIGEYITALAKHELISDISDKNQPIFLFHKEVISRILLAPIVIPLVPLKIIAAVIRIVEALFRAIFVFPIYKIFSTKKGSIATNDQEIINSEKKRIASLLMESLTAFFSAFAEIAQFIYSLGLIIPTIIFAYVCITNRDKQSIIDMANNFVITANKPYSTLYYLSIIGYTKENHEKNIFSIDLSTDHKSSNCHVNNREAYDCCSGQSIKRGAYDFILKDIVHDDISSCNKSDCHNADDVQHLPNNGINPSVYVNRECCSKKIDVKKSPESSESPKKENSDNGILYSKDSSTSSSIQTSLANVTSVSNEIGKLGNQTQEMI